MPGFVQYRRMLERWAQFPGRERVEPGGRAVLTFDDGPDPTTTPALLDALEAAGARATFFLLGEQLMRAPSIGGEIRRRGHEPALHGHEHTSHDDMWPGQTRDDVARALGTFQVACGMTPRWYRPPYGLLSEAGFGACQDLGLEPVYWSGWGSDWESVSAERIAELVCADLDDGAIVVLHDSARYTPRDTAEATVEAVPLIAAEAARRGLRLVTLGEAVGGERPGSAP